MSLDAAVARVQQILTLQQQLFDPAAAASRTTSAPPGTATSGTGSSFASALASAQDVAGTGAAGGSGGAAVNGSGYVNPLAGASVKAERIDQGVDYAGSGTVGAIGPAVVTKVVASGSGWEGGGYVEYKLTAGPYAGRSIYCAEGVTPTVSLGQTLSAGQPVARINPGSSTGIEMGFAAGQGEAAYASARGGGYSEGQLTAAGQAFSNLLTSLGAPAGLVEGRQVTGSFQ